MGNVGGVIVGLPVDPLPVKDDEPDPHEVSDMAAKANTLIRRAIRRIARPAYANTWHPVQ
jgi:hypothetical protein